MKKKNRKEKISVKILVRIMVILLIIILSLISFIGIYQKQKKNVNNIVTDYNFGMELFGSRNVNIEANTGTETKYYDADGKETTTTSGDGITSQEVLVNDESVLTTENYKKVKEILEKRLKYMKVTDYSIRLNNETGVINLEIPENSDADYIAQYMITTGLFKISDADTEECLLDNLDVKEATVGTTTSSTSSGTVVYLNIQFDKEGTEKLKNISNTYIQSTDADENSTTKKITMTLDDETIISTYFSEEISDGVIQLSIGTATDTDTLNSYSKQANNVAVFLNTESLPITYKMTVNRLVYSEITSNEIMIAVITLIIVAVAMIAYLIVKYRKQGIFALIMFIGFIAANVLIIRVPANIKITISGIIALIISSIIEYMIIIMLIEAVRRKKENKQAIQEEITKIIKCYIPVMIIAIVFAMFTKEEIGSFGTILFWGVLLMIIYNLLVSKVMILDIQYKEKIKKDKKNEKKEELKEKKNVVKEKKNNKLDKKKGTK